MKFLLQSDIERAIKQTRSNAAAARYLKVNYNTYKKYSKKYFDKEGNNLFEKHKNTAGVAISKTNLNTARYKYELDDILSNKHLDYPLQKLKDRLINHGYIEEKCELCGLDEQRVTDYKTPLLLSFKDEDFNFEIENLELLCYNCYFLTIGNIVGKKHEQKLGTKHD